MIAFNSLHKLITVNMQPGTRLFMVTGSMTSRFVVDLWQQEGQGTNSPLVQLRDSNIRSPPLPISVRSFVPKALTDLQANTMSTSY